jgi:hypothetical protein
MADTRPRVANTKQVNLAQLAVEVGAALCASDSEVVVAHEDSPVTAQQLEAAIAAHVADPAWVDPSDTDAVNERTLRDRATQALQANADFLALASPTNAQTLAQVKTLTRECSALIRLLLRKLDTTAGT